MLPEAWVYNTTLACYQWLTEGAKIMYINLTPDLPRLLHSMERNYIKVVYCDVLSYTILTQAVLENKPIQ